MKSSDRTLIAWVLAPTVAYVLGLFALMSWRMVSGQSPLPHGAMPAVLVLSMILPFGSAFSGNMLRLRRNVRGD